MTTGKARQGFLCGVLGSKITQHKCSYKQDWPVKGSPYCNIIMQTGAQVFNSFPVLPKVKIRLLF